MSVYSPADSLHRLVKQAIDTGAAASIAEAEAMFRGYQITFAIGPAEVNNPLHQATLLTGVSLARRVFLGGVTVTGEVDVPLRVPMPPVASLAEAVRMLGGLPGDSPVRNPRITIGGPPETKADGFHVRTQVAGWRGGIVPGHAEIMLTPGCAMPLAAMLSAGLAVNEAFLYINGKSGAAGRRAVGLSLWQPSTSDWLSAQDEPELKYLPSRLWLIGLGHLGQAYLWGLGLLPYPTPTGVSLVLQDVDRITPSSESTSVLTEGSMIGQMKTRAMSAWAERRGFSTAIHERLFDGSCQRQDQEPAVALCGIDNGHGRRALDQVGFDLVVEAGLGRGHNNFRSMRLHTLPGPRMAAELWKGNIPDEQTVDQAAYRQLLEGGLLDQCGITQLAGKAVGAPFVGSVAATLALSEVLRLLNGGSLHHVIEMDLASIEHRSVVPRDQIRNALNPGYVSAA
jgi:hypothetical protein